MDFRQLMGHITITVAGLQVQLLEQVAAEHLDSSRTVGENAARQPAEQAIRRSREHATDEGASESPAAVRVAGDADELAAASHQVEHVLDGQDGSHLVGGKDEHVLAAGRIDTGPDRVDDADAQTIVDQTHLRVDLLDPLHDLDAVILGGVVGHSRKNSVGDD